MSRRNGDRARFQKNRKRKITQRQRYREALARLAPGTADAAQPAAASSAPQA